MQPTLKDGMVILAEKINPSEVKPADIILHKTNGSLIAHRVIRIIRKDEARIFVTRGDNHAYMDAYFIPEGDIVGRVISVFAKDSPQKNLLIKNRLIDGMYVIIGNLLVWTRGNRELVPLPLRAVFKPFIGGSFLLFKKTTHFLHSFFQR